MTKSTEFTKTEFANALENYLKQNYKTSIEKATVSQLHIAIAKTVTAKIAENHEKSVNAHLNARRACYFSMEFLVGRAVYNNLLCTGLTNTVEEILSAHGRNLGELEEIEDEALGNGGLGRLAACFLDSAATHNLPLDGYGIRYKYGLFKQKIENGFQKEYADDWTRFSDPWSRICENDSVTVEYADQKVIAVPYDMPIIGYGTNNIGTLRLWEAKAVNEFDFDAFNNQDYDRSCREKNRAENISKVLYPNDSTDEGKALRLKQQYFFCSASLQDIIKKHKTVHGDISTLTNFVTIQLNDTHPVISIPELIRLLVEKEDYSFDDAFDVAHKVFNYTNHTIMAEALEKWNCGLFERILPNVYKYIILINERFANDMYTKKLDKQKIKELAPLGGGNVRMANIAIYVGSHTNGVAQIHTEILKNHALKDWYKLFPERFLNETNGITQRRWLALCNKELSKLITRLLGNENWITNLDELKNLEKYADDENILKEFIAIKQTKKQQLAEYIKATENIEIPTDAIYDIQIKRLHEYKRQLLNAFSILYIYEKIKSGEITDFTPTVFIFGAKSAPGYKRAKAIIKFINEIARLIENDPDVNKLIKVVFVSNYNVSYAEKLVPSADVSEQISTAGTEASGTGNMKLMLNGAVTLGTLDGANIEIVQQAGEENNYIFGAKVEELEKIMPEYDPRKIITENKYIKKVLDYLLTKTFDDGGKNSNEEGSFKELYTALTEGASWHTPDHYYVVGDLESYVEAKLKVNHDYKNKLAFARKCWLNIANAGKFSSDRTIKDYAENIWNIKPIEI